MLDVGFRCGIGSIALAMGLVAIGCGDIRRDADSFDQPVPLTGVGVGDDDAGETTDLTSGSDEAMPDDDAQESSDGGDPGAYPNVARLAKPDDWSVQADDRWIVPEPANWNDVPYFALSQAFYADHPDDYDFLVIYFEAVISEDFWATMIQTDDGVRGIGQDAWGDWTDPSEAGSAGRADRGDERDIAVRVRSERRRRHRA